MKSFHPHHHNDHHHHDHHHNDQQRKMQRTHCSVCFPLTTICTYSPWRLRREGVWRSRNQVFNVLAVEPNISAEIYGIFFSSVFPHLTAFVPVLTCSYSSHKFNGHWQFLGSVFEEEGGSHIFAYIISNSPVLHIKSYKIRKKISSHLGLV